MRLGGDRRDLGQAVAQCLEGSVGNFEVTLSDSDREIGLVLTVMVGAARGYQTQAVGHGDEIASLLRRIPPVVRFHPRETGFSQLSHSAFQSRWLEAECQGMC